MGQQTLAAANYRLPPLDLNAAHDRCRDCQEKTRAPGYGNRAWCQLHQVGVAHSHRCDHWHARGTLL